MRVVVRRDAGVVTRVVSVPVDVKRVVSVPIHVTRVVTLPAVEEDIATLVLRYVSLVSSEPVTLYVTHPETVYVTHVVSRLKKYVSTVVVHGSVQAGVSAVAEKQGAHPIAGHGGRRVSPPGKAERRVREVRVS